MKLHIKDEELDSFSSPMHFNDKTPNLAQTAAQTTFSPQTAQRENVINFNESLRQYITRIYGASVNPFIEANYHP
jgi:hypothetical protein